MIFQYAVKVNGLLMGTAPTFKGALALVTRKFHARERVTIERGGSVVWTSEVGR